VKAATASDGAKRSHDSLETNIAKQISLVASEYHIKEQKAVHDAAASAAESSKALKLPPTEAWKVAYAASQKAAIEGDVEARNAELKAAAEVLRPHVDFLVEETGWEETHDSAE